MSTDSTSSPDPAPTDSTPTPDPAPIAENFGRIARPSTPTTQAQELFARNEELRRAQQRVWGNDNDGRIA
jgi:hypothetical protein